MIPAHEVKKGDWIKHYREGDIVISEVLEIDHETAISGTIYTTNGALCMEYTKVFERRSPDDKANSSTS